jgi:hypothetical protein
MDASKILKELAAERRAIKAMKKAMARLDPRTPRWAKGLWSTSWGAPWHQADHNDLPTAGVGVRNKPRPPVLPRGVSVSPDEIS